MDRIDVATALSLVVGFLLVVLVENVLHAAGLETLGTAVYPVGYGTLALVAWYVWIRPLDLRPPTLDEDDAEDPETADARRE